MFGNNKCDELKRKIDEIARKISYLDNRIVSYNVDQIDLCLKQLKRYKEEYEKLSDSLDEFKTRVYSFDKYIDRVLTQLNTIMANLTIINSEIIRILKEIAELKKK